MNYLLTCLFSFFIFHGQAQTSVQKDMDTEISEVTVFLEGANITRTGSLNLNEGTTDIIIRSLSPYIDEKSIKVKANGEFTVLAVANRINYFSPELQKLELVHLDERRDSLSLKIQLLEAASEVLDEKSKLLAANRKLLGTYASLSIADLDSTLEYFSKQFTTIKTSEINIENDILDLIEEKDKLEKQFDLIANHEKLPRSEIVIRVDCPSDTKGNFEISYLVENAGWFPNYDIRVASVDQALELTYKASMYQNTGVDWENVKLKFSNASPITTRVAPQLSTWNIDYARSTKYTYPSSSLRNINSISGVITDSENSPLIGANIILEGSTIGTITDIDGRYSLQLPYGARRIVVSFVGFESKVIPIKSNRLNVSLEAAGSLEEVVVTGYSVKAVPTSDLTTLSRRRSRNKVVTRTVENQTSVYFEIEKPYSKKSNSKSISIDLHTYNIEVGYKYYVVPKLDENAFLLAIISDWDQYNLLEGEANLYFQDSYVGRTILNTKVPSDTLEVSLGTDKSIVVERSKVERFTQKRIIGTNKIESRTYTIQIRNRKSSPVSIIIQDQIPVSNNSDISVEAVEVSGGSLDEKSGNVNWNMDLPSMEQNEIILTYKVKYPKREKIVLD